MSTHNEVREIAIESTFSEEAWAERKRYISILRKFADLTVEASDTLEKIKEKKLYQPHKSVKEFCEKECGWTKQRFYQLVDFQKVRAALPEKSQPRLTTERQARELKQVPEDKRAEVLDIAERVYSKDGKITGKSIEQAADAISGPVDKAGYPIPTKAMPYWNRRDEVQRLLAILSAAKVALANIASGDPIYRRVNNVSSKADKLKDYYGEFKGALPDYVCYSCDGLTPRDCRLCGGTGVVSEFEWRSKADPEGHHRREKALRRMKDPF